MSKTIEFDQETQGILKVKEIIQWEDVHEEGKTKLLLA
jgi:hypothetical protein